MKEAGMGEKGSLRSSGEYAGTKRQAPRSAPHNCAALITAINTTSPTASRKLSFSIAEAPNCSYFVLYSLFVLIASEFSSRIYFNADNRDVTLPAR